MEVHIKHESLVPALKKLEKFSVTYSVKDGIVFGKPCYWIEIVSLKGFDETYIAMRSISEFEQVSE